MYDALSVTQRLLSQAEVLLLSQRRCVVLILFRVPSKICVLWEGGASVGVNFDLFKCRDLHKNIDIRKHNS